MLTKANTFKPVWNLHNFLPTLYIWLKWKGLDIPFDLVLLRCVATGALQIFESNLKIKVQREIFHFFFSSILRLSKYICAPCHNLYEWCACYLQQHRQSKRTKFISHRSGFYSHRHASIIPLRPSRAPHHPWPCPPSVDKHTGLCAGNVCPL